MEAELWRHVRHVHMRYYRILDASDVPVPRLTTRAGAIDNTGPDGYHSQRDANVHINLTRLHGLIHSALKELVPHLVEVSHASDAPVPTPSTEAGAIDNTGPDGYHGQRDANVHNSLTRLHGLIHSALKGASAALG